MTPGRVLRDRYRIEETIGSGAQGEVYRAVDLRHGRSVAIKTRPSSDPAVSAEARALYDIRPHPSLPLLREDFTDGDEVCLVMDWVDGTTLRSLLERDGPFDLARTIEALAPVAAAIDHLHGHARPVVHGDVKPENIIRADQTGEIVLVDLGLVGLHHAGTRGYRAAEASTGMRGSASDVYGLAATAYTMLTGQVPAAGPFADMPRVGPAQHEHVRQVIEWGLQTVPDRRPRRATTFVEALAGASARHNLPAQSTSFVGRIDELQDLDERVRSRRLVTIAGAGGAGKTRLAVEVAARVAAFTGGATFVDLVSIRAGVAAQVLHAAGETETRGDAEHAVLTMLAERECLLVLDNAEHILSETAAMCARILERCPAVRILVTSREPLGLPGESVLRVAGLPTSTHAGVSEAARLLLARIGDAGAGGSPTPADVDVAAAIAQRLDGLPLALELAAARAVAIGLPLLADAVEGGSDALGVKHNEPAQRRTLAAMVDHSYAMLDAATQRALRAASLLTGGIDVDVLAEIAGMDGRQTRLALARAASASMLERQGDRFRLLEPVRQRLQEHLAASGEVHADERRMDAWTERVFREACVLSLRYDEPVRARFVREEANLRLRLDEVLARDAMDVDILLGVAAAYDAISRTDDAIAILERARDAHRARGTDLPLRGRAALARMMGARYLMDRARPLAAAVLADAREGGDRVAQIEMLLGSAKTILRDSRELGLAECEEADRLIRGDEPELHAHALLARSKLVTELGRLDEARAVVAELEDLAGRHGFGVALDHAQIRRVIIEANSGNRALAGELCVRLLERLRRTGPPARLGEALNMRGHFHRYAGQLDEAEAHYDEAMRTWEAVGDPRAYVIALYNLGNVALDRGRYTEANAIYERAHAEATARGHRETAANAVGAMAEVARRRGRIDDARRYLGLALPALRELGDQVLLADVIFQLAHVERDDGRLEAARDAAEEALAIFSRLGRETTQEVQAFLATLTGVSA